MLVFNKHQQRKIDYATQHGIDNADAALAACLTVSGLPYAAALALLSMESHGANVYGHDAGGVMSTADGPVTVCGTTYPKGSTIEVTPANAGIFLGRVFDPNATSNGIGPCQVTYAKPLPDGRWGGYFRQMLEANLLPWVPVDNMVFGFGLLAGNFHATGSWIEAGSLYNGGPGWRSNPHAVAYGQDFDNARRTWHKGLATA